MSIIITIVYSFLPLKPILNITSNIGRSVGNGWEWDKTPIVEEDKHKLPPSERPEEEDKQIIIIPADETYRGWRTRTLKEAAVHDRAAYPSAPRRRDSPITIKEGTRIAPMKRTSKPPGKGKNQERKSARQ